MKCLVCESELDSKSGRTICSESCKDVFLRKETREVALAAERRFAQCQVCSGHYSPTRGDSHFCSLRCRQAMWGSFAA